MEKIVTYTKYGSFNSQFGYTNVYTFEDAAGNIYVWKTGSGLYCGNEDVTKGSTIKIKFNENGESEYKGTKQIKITRVKVLKVIERAKSWSEIKAERDEEKRQSELTKQQKIINSLRDDEVIWEMPYSMYKNNYSNYTIIPGSFKRYNDANRWSPGTTTICVVVGNGNFGRTSKYKNFRLKSSSGKELIYRATTKYQALHFIEEIFPEDTWEVVE